MKSFPANVFQTNKTQLQNKQIYSIIFEIKKTYIRKLRKTEIKKQINKYNKILHLLSLGPELKEIKNKLKIANNNKLIFSLVTNGEYKHFFNRKLLIEQKKNFKKDILSDLEMKKSKTSFEEMMDSFDKIHIPVLIFLVPSLYQGFDNPKLNIQTNELIEKQQKTIISMEKELNKQKEIIKEQDKKQLQMKKKQDEMEKEMQLKQNEMKKMIDEMKKELMAQKIMMEKEKEEFMKSIKEKELINQKK